MKIDPKDLVSARDFRRELGGHLHSLAKNRRKKFILTRHGRPMAVVVSLAEYERLTEE